MPSNPQRQALFVVLDMAQFGELLQVAQTLVKSGRYAAQFGFFTAYPTSAADKQKCVDHGMTWFDEASDYQPPRTTIGRLKWLLGYKSPVESLHAESTVAQAPAGAASGLPISSGNQPANLKRVARRAARILIQQFRAFAGPIYTVNYYLHRMRRFRTTLAERRPHVVVLAEDNVSHGTGLFTKIAHEHGCRVVVSPYTVANALEPAESYYDLPEHQMSRWSNWIVGTLLPHWVFAYRGRSLLRMPAAHAAAQQLLGIAPPQPWALNSGHADAIVVESRKRVDYYRSAGLVREPLIATGGSFDDELASYLADREAARRRLCERHRLPPDRPLLLCGLPPNQLVGRPHAQFHVFADLVRAWLKPIAAQHRFNVIVRLHPRLSRRELRFIETELGLAISEEPTARLIAMSDLYVASVSATIRWAIACGVPVINYDVFRYRYDDYDDARGVVTVQSHDAYVAEVRRVCNAPDYYRQLRAQQISCQEEWGRLDGSSGARLVAVFDCLLEGRLPDLHAVDSHPAAADATVWPSRAA